MPSITTPASARSGLVVYGAYGYSGSLIAREAVARELPVTLAGRDAERLEALGGELGVPWWACALDRPQELRERLGTAAAVLHCAGPFSETWRPMVEACLERRVHYLDITGEAAVFEALSGLSERAVEAGIVLLPGVGFDVVPSDCLAAHLKRRLPDATRLALAFQSSGRPSRGTATTAVRRLHEGGLVRRDGELVRVPLAWRSRSIDFGEGPRLAVTIPWGDVATAWYTTGVPNIEVYMAISPKALRRLRRLRRVRPLLGLRPVQALLERGVRRGPAGPSERRLEEDVTRQWGEAVNEAGERVATRQRGPQAYRWTALAAVTVAERVLGGEAPTGFRTPAGAFGPDLVLHTGEVEREDLYPRAGAASA